MPQPASYIFCLFTDYILFLFTFALFSFSLYLLCTVTGKEKHIKEKQFKARTRFCGRESNFREKKENKQPTEAGRGCVN